MELPHSEYPPGTSRRDIDRRYERRDTCSIDGAELDEDGSCPYCNLMDHWADRAEHEP